MLQPYLSARSSTPYGLWDDDSLPSGPAADDAQRILAGRPDVSNLTGRILLGKRKRDMSSALAQAGGAGMTAAGAGSMMGLGVSLPSKQKIMTSAGKGNLPATVVTA